MNNTRDTFQELRGSFDGQDPFMTQGHQIIKMRRSDRATPEWAKSNKRIQEILLRSFPKLRTDPVQRGRAARWALVIQLYYRVHMTRSEVAAQMKSRQKVVNRLIENINLAAKGLKTNGKGAFTGRPAGRPKSK